MAKRAALWMIALGLSLVVQTARAQDEAASPSGYREAIDQALSELRLEHFEEARAMFARAHELLPSARTLRGLGMAEFELRSYVASSEHLEQALRSEVRPLNDEQRRETEQLLARANRYLTKLSLRIVPSGARVILDGAPLSSLELRIAAGDHTLEVSAPSRIAQRKAVSAVGGDVQEVAITLVPLAPVPPQRDDRPRSWVRNPWLWTGVGVLVAGAAVTTGLLLAREDGPRPYGGSSNVSIESF